MINIVIPMAGENQYFDEKEYPYPKPLIEINGKTMIEYVVSNFESIKDDKKYIFIVNSDDCKKYHIDNVLNILTRENCEIIKIDKATKGAACSAMMAIEFIDNNHPLIIANADQIFDLDLNEVANAINDADGAVIVFDSVHPRWSFVRLDSEGDIVETAEKRPLSNNAIAGFYYYKNGKDFIESAKKMIKKDANVNGSFFVSPTFNEMILQNKKLVTYKIPNDTYHTFYTPRKIQEYERMKQC